MQVATTTNNQHNSQSHHHQPQSQPQQQLQRQHSNDSNTLGIVATSFGSSGARSPFQREVREWQRIDPGTGALLSGRLEADRWSNGPLNSYGKISDSQNISQPNGTQHTQRKQLEVLQARTASGSMQVIRTQKVQTTSSRWSSSINTNSIPTANATASIIAPTTATTTTTAVLAANEEMKHIPKTKQSHHYPNAHWAQLPTQICSSLDICEVSNVGDNRNGDDDEHDSHNGHMDDANHVVVADDNDFAVETKSNYLINGNSRNNNLTNSNDTITSTSNSNSSSNRNSFHRVRNSLLLDTAPSLKLSNLMKSSSSISSNSSNNSISTMSNTHRNASKISLHAIVGNNTKSTPSASGGEMEERATIATSSSSTSLASSTASSTWHKQQRLSEQPDLYGNSNNKSISSRVGVSTSFSNGSGGGGGGGGDVDDGVGGAALESETISTPTQLNRRQTRRDLESFRHYNEHEHATQPNDDADEASADDDDLRLSARHQRRQQVPQYTPIPLQRSRSISTDDLSNDWERNQLTVDSGEQPGEWRRVSKLRRSFQSQIRASEYNTSAKSTTPSHSTPRRPVDLPTNSVSVSRIRAELENGRRLNTAMRNNHVDLAALDTLLNSTSKEAKTETVKTCSFLTAESLKEIRGKLKKLSDESLYKDDILAYQPSRQTPDIEEEDIEVQLVKPVPQTHSPTLITPTRSAFQPVKQSHNSYFSQQQTSAPGQPQHTTHSLESRQKYRDTNSSEWHLRRKSYGFEKMSPPDDKMIVRVDASTDSGLGRSGEQLGNWSPTVDSAATAPRGIIVHFGGESSVAKPNFLQQKSIDSTASPNSELNKRHSIAVEESQYMRKTSQVRINGDGTEQSSSLTDSTSTRTQQKRVEFCKTEVHFAAESGRVNIVETDGKPPPTNNFRRRRRTASGPLQNLVKSAAPTNGVALPITHFGDDQNRRKTIATSTVAYKATLMEAPEVVTQTPTQVTVSIPKKLESSLTESTSRNSYTSTSGVDTDETDELSNIRGILKNKPIKPRPYVLGENIDSADALWGVQLKSVNAGGANTVRQSTPEEDTSVPIKSVAERIRIVEKRQVDTLHNHNGYSTKINLNLGEKDWTDTDAVVESRRPSAQELLLQDLRVHQRILDEGLKSTSLIIKTMRSATEFDEAMRRLSIASIESAFIQPTIVVPTPMLRSNSYQESTTSTRRSSNTSITNSDLFGSALYGTIPRRYSGDGFSAPAPMAPPRLKLLCNSETPVSQQLTQLRRMYDAATEEFDSADEEVKSYFASDSRDDNSDSGGGTQDSSSLEDVRAGTEYSSSWSRLKTNHTIWKIESDERQPLQLAVDIPQSNVMNIALHSPNTDQHATAAPKPTPSLRITQLTPVAKPRTNANTHTSNQAELHVAATVRQQAVETSGNESTTSESLRIVKETRGARKLREHELSYFGVPGTKMDNAPVKLGERPRRTLPTRRVSNEREEKAHANGSVTQWQLINDRPDLLQHSPVAGQQDAVTSTRTQRPSDKQESEFEVDFDEHFYENIVNDLTPTFRVKSPVTDRDSYNRKTDVQRDALILSEMTRNADQTLKALSDEAALKDQRRRSTSLQRRNVKPLETIDERAYREKPTVESFNVARSTFASEARRNSRHSTPSPTPARSSSQSSTEYCPRARSRSLSSEREYENIKPRASVRPSPAPQTIGRSSDSCTQCSSADERDLKREERARMRTPKRVSSHSSHSQERHASEQGKLRSSSMRTIRDKLPLESRERQPRGHNTSHRHKSDAPQRLSRTSGTNSYREKHSSSSGHGSRHVSRSLREHEHDMTAKQHSNSHKVERSDKEHKERLLTRSRGHSNRSKHHSEREREHERKSASTAAHTKHTRTTDLKKSSHRQSSTTASMNHATGGMKPSNKSSSQMPPITHEHESLTVGKNTKLLPNGHYGSGGHQQQHHIHSLTTTTIAAKQRERHVKDRK